MKKSKPLVFFGTEDFSAASLQALLRDGWPVEAIVTKPDTRSGRGQRLSEPKVKQIGVSHNIEVLQPSSLIDIQAKLQGIGANYAVLVAYGKIVPQSVIDVFNGSVINVHPSLLPKYRGPAPIEAAILNGDSETGISLMKLVAQMDAGPVYYQEQVGLSGYDTRLELSQKLAQKSANLLTAKLPGIIDSRITPQPQSDNQATYTKLIRKEDGVIDWQKPAVQLEREVRAYSGWPKSRTELFGQLVIITKVRIATDKNDGDLVMPTGDGYLEILELTAPSGRSMSGGDFVRGYSKS